MKRRNQLFPDDGAPAQTMNDLKTTADTNKTNLHRELELLNKDRQLIQNLIHAQETNADVKSNIQNAIAAIDKHGDQSNRCPFSIKDLKNQLNEKLEPLNTGLVHKFENGLETFVDKFADGFGYLENKLYGMFSSHSTSVTSHSTSVDRTAHYLTSLSSEYTKQLKDLRRQIDNKLVEILNEISSDNQTLKSSQIPKNG